MKKRSLLLIALIAVLCLSIVGAVACKPGETVDPDKQSIEISNAMALAAKWNVGEADRTVEVTLSDGLKDKVVTLTAEPQGIVTIDGMKLTAAKNGTTVVTARVSLDEEHEYTDSVEIKVTYNYSLTVSNKANLTKAFRIGEADREVTVALSDGIKNNKVDIKSSNTNAVTVVNGKLHALAKGESTITATTSLNGVEFKDTFKVTVWGAFDLQVTNKAALEGVLGKADDPRAIAVDLVEAGDYTLSDVTATPANAQVVKVEDMKIVPVGVGKTTVTVACGEGTDRKEVVINVTVEVTPVLTLGEFDKTAERYVGESFELPEILTATDSSENDVKANVTVTCDNSALTISDDKTTASADQIGRYTVTYKFTDPSKGDKIVELTFDVVEKIFSSTGAHAGNDSESLPLGDAKITTKLEGEEGNWKQVTTSSSDDLVFAKLNGGEASKLYYAEATFDITTVRVNSQDINVSLGHFLTGENDRHALLSVLNVNTSDFVQLDPTFNKVGNITKSQAENNNQEYAFAYKIFKSRKINPEQQETNHVTIAIARDGEYFYTFVDGQYIMCVTFKDFRNDVTVPAIAGNRYKGGEVKVSNIQYLYEETAVKEKLYAENGLLGPNKEKMIVPFVNKYDGGSVTTTNYGGSINENVSINTNIDASANRGLAFDYTNNGNGRYDSAVSPYVYFDGNFTFSWEYEMTGVSATINENTDKYRSILELKDASLPDSNVAIAQLGLGTDKADVNQIQELEFNTKDYQKKNGYVTWAQVKGIIEKGTKVKFTMSRILKDDHAEIILTATYGSGESQTTITRIVPFGNVADENLTLQNKQLDSRRVEAQTKWAMSVVPYWCNSGFSGQFSNISWSILPDDITAEFVTESTDITSSTRLTETTTPDDGSEPVTTNLDQWQFTLSDFNNSDIVLDLGENALEAGEYTVAIAAQFVSHQKGTTTKFASTDIELCGIYTTTITVAEGDRYLKLNGLTLGHGTYNITLTKVVEPAPDPAPQEPTA